MAYPDGGYGWVIVACAGVISGLCASMMRCMGQFYVSMLHDMNHEKNQLAAILILPKVLSPICSVFANKLAQIYSFKFILFLGSFLYGLGLSLSSIAVEDTGMFTLTFGIIIGLGNACLLTPSTNITGLYFTKRRSLAISTLMTITGILSFIMPILIQYLLNEYKLRGTLLLAGGILLQGTVAAMFIRQPTWIQQTQIPNDKNFFQRINFFLKLIVSELIRDCQHFSNFTFILLLINKIAYFFAVTSLYLILPQFALEQIDGITPTQSAYLLSVMCIGEVVCRWLAGWINKFFNKHEIQLYLFSLVASAFAVLSFSFTVSYFSIVFVSIVYGVFNGYAFVSHFLVLFNVFGPSKAPGLNALQNAVTGLCLLAAGPIMVWIHDVTGSYRHCFTFLACFLLLSVVNWMWMVLQQMVKCDKTNEDEDKS